MYPARRACFFFFLIKEVNPTPCKQSLLFLLLDQGGEPHTLQAEPAFSSSWSRRRLIPHPASRASSFLLLDRGGEHHTLQAEPAFSSSWSRRRNGSYAKVASMKHLKYLPTPDELTKCSDIVHVFFSWSRSNEPFSIDGGLSILFKYYLLALFVVPVTRCIFL